MYWGNINFYPKIRSDLQLNKYFIWELYIYTEKKYPLNKYFCTVTVINISVKKKKTCNNCFCTVINIFTLQLIVFYCHKYVCMACMGDCKHVNANSFLKTHHSPSWSHLLNRLLKIYLSYL